MTERASIDRFEGKWAVLLVGDPARVVNVRRSSLPKGSKEGHWLLVEFKDDHLLSVQLDPEETERVRKRIEAKLERLRRGEHLD